MISSNQVIVTGGQFSQNHYHGQASVGTKAPIDILTDAVAPSAFHDSGARFDPPKCHPGTRVKILALIMRWIVGQDEEARSKSFMWLSGAAGCGKSAIAQSTVELCLEQRLQLASFFFSRADLARNNAGALVATLAYQLYCAFPESEAVPSAILAEIKKDPFLFRRTIQQQFTSLIVQPLKAYRSNDSSTHLRTPFLIMIDGLDECMDRASQKAILIGLAESMRGAASYLRIFIASRPEHDIRLSFSSKNLKNIHALLALDLLNQDEADSDIKQYFLYRFAEIREDFDSRTSGKKLGQSWPGERLVEKLVKRASGQFIYASTVIRYIESTRHRPDYRLDIVMKLRPHDDGDHPFAELDALYAMILESCSNIERALHVISFHSMHNHRFLCSEIEKILAYEEGEIEMLFSDLGSLVQITEHRPTGAEQPQRYVKMLHASLYDYFVDATRSKQFRIDTQQETIHHIACILHFLASSCCSSSFNPNSKPEAILLHIFFNNAYICRVGAISLELRHAALAFPLKGFLEPHITTPTFTELLKFFVCPFLDLIGIIAEKDSQWSHIRDNQHKALESVLNPQIERYFVEDKLAAILVLFYHLGSHRFVPILWSHMPPFSRGTHSSPFNHFELFLKSDTLSLSYLWIGFTAVDQGSRVPFKHNFYHDYVRHFLSKPGASAKWALGPETYEKAALFCLKSILYSKPIPDESGLGQNMAIVNEEDDYFGLLISKDDDGQWILQCSYAFPLGGGYFLLLGYIIFLLPQCGRSEALISACKEQKARLLEEPPNLHFPVRRRLLFKEINNYLDRVSGNSNL